MKKNTRLHQLRGDAQYERKIGHKIRSRGIII